MSQSDSFIKNISDLPNVAVVDIKLPNEKRIAALSAFGFITNGIEAIQWLNEKIISLQSEDELPFEFKTKIVGKMTVGISNTFQGVEVFLNLVLSAPEFKAAWDERKKSIKESGKKIANHDLTPKIEFILDTHPELKRNYAAFTHPGDEKLARQEIITLSKLLTDQFFKSRYYLLSNDASLSLFNPKTAKILAFFLAITFNLLKVEVAMLILSEET